MLFDNKTSQDLSLDFMFQSDSLTALMIVFFRKMDQIFDMNSDNLIYELIQNRIREKLMSLVHENMFTFIFPHRTDII